MSGRLAATLHACPWSLSLRAALATAVLDSKPEAALLAARLCAPPPLLRAPTDDAATAAARREMLRVRGSGALAAGSGAGVESIAAELRVRLFFCFYRTPLRFFCFAHPCDSFGFANGTYWLKLLPAHQVMQCRLRQCGLSCPSPDHKPQPCMGGHHVNCPSCLAQALKRALHAQPWDAEAWCLVALAAVQLAAARPTAGLARAAEAACSAALATAQRTDAPVQNWFPGLFLPGRRVTISHPEA